MRTPFFLLFFLIALASISSAVIIGTSPQNNSYSGVNILNPAVTSVSVNNNTLNVNNSQYLNGLNSSAFILRASDTVTSGTFKFANSLLTEYVLISAGVFPAIEFINSKLIFYAGSFNRYLDDAQQAYGSSDDVIQYFGSDDIFHITVQPNVLGDVVIDQGAQSYTFKNGLSFNTLGTGVQLSGASGQEDLAFTDLNTGDQGCVRWWDSNANNGGTEQAHMCYTMSSGGFDWDALGKNYLKVNGNTQLQIFDGSVQVVNSFTAQQDATVSGNLLVSGKTDMTQSLNVGQGLNVTGSTRLNRTGVIASISNASLIMARVGGVLFQNYTNGRNIGTGQTTLYNFTLANFTLLKNGDSIRGYVVGNMSKVSTATEMVNIYLNDSLLLSTGVKTLMSEGAWRLDFNIIRDSSTTAVTTTAYTTTTLNGTAQVNQTDVTGLNWNNNNTISIKGTSGGAGGGSDQIVAKMGSGEWLPSVS